MAAGLAPGDVARRQRRRPRRPAREPVQLAAVGLCKSYRKGHVEIPVLRGVDLEVRRGEFLAIIGQSGSGKSTLLHLLGTLDAPDAGRDPLRRPADRQSARPPAAIALRNQQFGMIFQFYHLLPELTTLENVLVAADDRRTACWSYLRSRREHRRAGHASCWRWSGWRIG